MNKMKKMTIDESAGTTQVPSESSGTTPIDTGGTASEQEEIARLAYELWMQRGCPLGSPEEDWCRAEEQLRHRPLAATASAPE